jgi:putative restriction endonuclease
MLDYISLVENLRLNRAGEIVSLHKPLLILFCISEIDKGSPNIFYFDKIEIQITSLIQKYGLKNTKIIKPEYPFLFLSSDNQLWNCSVNKFNLKYPDSPSKSDLQGSYGSFTDDFLGFLKVKENRINLVKSILNSYWSEYYYCDILTDLGLLSYFKFFNSKSSYRSQKFVEDVLDFYERKCAICNQSIRLADSLIGIDACHLRPLQHKGSDTINNGIALCKVHHWALDRGAISLNQNYKILVSKKMNGQMADEYFFQYELKDIFIPRNEDNHLDISNIDYHYQYIFFK